MSLAINTYDTVLSPKIIPRDMKLNDIWERLTAVIDLTTIQNFINGKTRKNS